MVEVKLCTQIFIAGSDEKEVIVLKGRNHPHIVQFFGHWLMGNKSHMMMELMPESLTTHIDKRNGT
jgi:hypothetical protein